MTDTYDVIVLGAGPTGENAADRAVKGGLSALIVESELVGGECSYWACIPSKALLRPTAAVSEAEHLRGVSGARLDPAGVFARRTGFTHDWNDDSQVDWLKREHIDLIRGAGRVTTTRSVRVGDKDFTARHAVVIATGTSAVVPDSLTQARPWTSRDATGATSAPPRLVIVGGGVVGCEMATAFQALGSQVTLLSRGRLLDRTEDFAGELVADGLRASGADVRTGAEVASASRDDDGTVLATLTDGTTVRGDELLAAAGRAPKTYDIGLETIGLAPGSWLDVDDTMRVRDVDGGWLYACGDVNHRAMLTHMGKYQARICGDAIAARAAGREPSVTDVAPVPQVIFTMPEVASVGLTSARAAAAGLPVGVVDYDLASVAGASLFQDGYTGKARMLVDEDRRVIVGMTLAGPGVGEMIHSATVAVAGAVPLETLWHAVPSYPTMSELWLRLLETYGL